MNASYTVVNVGDKKHPVYLPVETCKFLPNQPVVAKLNPDQTREIIWFACRTPAREC
jgi:hypothetical protein